MMVVYFQTILDYDDNRLVSNDLVLWFDVTIVYFQTLNYDDGRLFSNKFIIWSNVMSAYFQMTSYYNPMWWLFIFK